MKLQTHFIQLSAANDFVSLKTKLFSIATDSRPLSDCVRACFRCWPYAVLTMLSLEQFPGCDVIEVVRSEESDEAPVNHRIVL